VRAKEVGHVAAPSRRIPSGIQDEARRARSCRSISRGLADEFEPSGQTIRNRVRQAQLDAGDRKDGLTTDERQEIARLRKRVKQLEMEREILSKATAWFARESMDSKRSSDS